MADDRVFRVPRHAKLRNVEAFELVLLTDTHALHRIHEGEDDVGCAEAPQGAERGAAELADELARIAVEQSGHALAGTPEIRRRPHAVPSGAVGAVGKESDAHGAKPAAVPVDRDGPAGVVDLDDPFIEENPQADDDARQDAN